MKKMILGLAALAAGSVMAIESANIVGYTMQDKTGSQYTSIGPCFVSVGSNTGTTFKLGDIKLTGSACDKDFLQVLNSTSASVVDAYYYYTIEEAIADGCDPEEAGWYDQSLEVSKDDITFDIGQGFLANFLSKNAEITYAGQVLEGAHTIDCRGKQYVMIPNFLPRNIKLGEIVLSGSACDKDFLQKLSTETASTTEAYYYYSVEEAIADGCDPEEAGWYDQSLEESKDDVVISSGDALLANFLTKDVQVTFPSAL